MSIYAIYKNKKYRLDTSDNKLEIYTEIKDLSNDSFNEFKIEQGFFSKVVYTKEVNMDEIDMAYELEYKAIYKGKEFEIFGFGKFLLEENNMTIYTKDSTVAHKYGFIKTEQFVFDKHVSLDDVDSIIEIKKPILKFNLIKHDKQIIEKKDIRGYLKNIID